MIRSVGSEATLSGGYVGEKIPGPAKDLLDENTTKRYDGRIFRQFIKLRDVDTD